MFKRVSPLVCILCITPFLCRSQVTVRAMVADSATFKPIAYVNIRVLGTFKGTITNEQGQFVFEASPKDTLRFSIIGYDTKKIVAAEVLKAPVVYLTQAVNTLKTIEIRAAVDIRSVLPKPDEKSVYKNPNQNFRGIEVKGFQGFETFGPGYASGFGDLKPSKEEKKLERVKKENAHAKGYVVLVNDPQVKDSLMHLYNITEAKYYEHLANFNQKNKDFIYQLDDTDLVNMIFLYFKSVIK